MDFRKLEVIPSIAVLISVIVLIFEVLIYDRAYWVHEYGQPVRLA